MSISIFGLGYVGSVTAACLAERGMSVVCVDVNKDKIRSVNAGTSPIVEPAMQELIARSVAQGRISATCDVAMAVAATDISFICVGTPSLPKGKLDLSNISEVCQQIGPALAQKQRRHIIVVRSTMLPGSTEHFVIPWLEQASSKKGQKDFIVCVNPEFLREGTAVDDFFDPPMIVIGSAEPEHAAVIIDLYKGISGPVFCTDIASAEMVKYACNAFHAVKVAFANEIGTLGMHIGVNPDTVAEVFCSDAKLNVSAAYLRPGGAFGGSCLPKDIRALNYLSKELDLDLPLLRSVLPSNEKHIERTVNEILKLKGRKVGFLGLSFKANTDDLRESPNVLLVKRLLGEGFTVRIWDDNVSLGLLIGSNRQYITDTIPHVGSLLRRSMDEVIRSCDIVVLATTALLEDDIRAQLRPDQRFINITRLPKSVVEVQSACV